jgi:hypothetical protein
VRACDVLVPFYGSNGSTLQFGYVTMLNPGFLRIVLVSDQLHLTDDEQCNKAAKHWIAMLQLCGDDLKLADKVTNKFPDALDGYWLKHVTLPKQNPNAALFFPLFGADRAGIQRSLLQMILTLGLLNTTATRQLVAFPKSIVSHDAALLLVFEKLEGFRIGMPDNQELCKRVALAVRAAAEAVHNAGVVHLDLYLSNVMWRQNAANTTIEVKIVDWDTCHRVDEPISDTAVSILQNGSRSHLVGDDCKTSKALDLWFCDILERNSHHQTLKTTDKEQLDAGFFVLCAEPPSETLASALGNLDVSAGQDN